MKRQLNLLTLSIGACLTLLATNNQAAPAPNAGQLLQQQQQGQMLTGCAGFASCLFRSFGILARGGALKSLWCSLGCLGLPAR